MNKNLTEIDLTISGLEERQKVLLSKRKNLQQNIN